MEDWNGIAKLIGFKDEKSMLEYFYLDEELGVKDIATKLNAGQATIANRLRKHQIPMRTRGGANNSQRITKRLFRMDQRRVFLTSDQELSKALNCSSSMVYKYKRSVKLGRLPTLQVAAHTS